MPVGGLHFAFAACPSNLSNSKVDLRCKFAFSGNISGVRRVKITRRTPPPRASFHHNVKAGPSSREHEDLPLSSTYSNANVAETEKASRRSRRASRAGVNLGVKGDARSKIGKRALNDIAKVRGFVQRTTESMRIRAGTLAGVVFAQGTSLLGVLPTRGWSSLKAFNWQNVPGAALMEGDEVERTRALQRVQRQRTVLETLRGEPLGVFKSASKAVNFFGSKVSGVMASIATASKSRQKSMGVAASKRLAARRAARASRMQVSLSPSGPAVNKAVREGTRHASEQQSSPKTRGPWFGSKGVGQRKVGPSTGTAGKKSRRSQGSKPDSTVPLRPVFPPAGSTAVGPSSPGSRPGIGVGVGVGAAALGLGAFVSGGVVPVIATASFAVVAAASLLKPGSASAATGAPRAIPGYRRSRVVQRIDEALLNAANPVQSPVVESAGKVDLSTATEATRMTSPPTNIFLPLEKIARSPNAQRLLIDLRGRLPGKEAGNDRSQFNPRKASTKRSASVAVPRPPPATEYMYADSDELEPAVLLQHVRQKQDVDSFAPVGNVAVDASHHENGPGLAGVIDTESVINVDYHAVTPSTPAVFSIPFFGKLLSALDEIAYSFERLVSRVVRRTAAAGVGVASVRAGSSKWKLHDHLRRSHDEV